MVFNLRTFSFTSSDEGDSTPPKSFTLKELRVATHNYSRANLLAYRGFAKVYRGRLAIEGDSTPPKSPPKSFSLEELRVATHNFSRANLLAYRGFAKIYRGRLADGSLVSVKRAIIGNHYREEKFEAEVQVGSKVSTHPNVLCLRGFYRTKQEGFLVYPLMIKGSLACHLRERSDRFARPLDWTTRKRIALGAARGLAHLHDQDDIKIMHRNFSTSHILLNGHFEVVIGGFSLAMIMHERNVEQGTSEWSPPMPRQVTGDSFLSPVGETSADSDSDSESCHRYEDVYISTMVCGTCGFIAPEYFLTSKCTLKNDVFAYGSVLLELISGQHRLCMPLRDWIEKQVKEGQLGRVIDPNLQGNYMEDEAEQLVRLALLCTQWDPSVRPKMSEVVRMLESPFLQRGP